MQIPGNGVRRERGGPVRVLGWQGGGGEKSKQGEAHKQIVSYMV
jgi:hypothetical protein